MWNSESGSGWGGWGFIIFFIFLFYAFNNGGLGGRNSGTALQDTARTSAELSFANFNQLKDLQCTVGRNDAVLDGKLETGFRAVLANDDKNTVEILRGQDQTYIKQLERENAQLFATNQAQETRNLLLASEARLERRLDGIECDMLKRSPQYVRSCVPCASDAFNSGGGYA